MLRSERNHRFFLYRRCLFNWRIAGSKGANASSLKQFRRNLEVFGAGFCFSVRNGARNSADREARLEINLFASGGDARGHLCIHGALRVYAAPAIATFYQHLINAETGEVEMTGNQMSGNAIYRDLAKRFTLTSTHSHTIGPMKPDSVNRNTQRFACLLQTKEY